MWLSTRYIRIAAEFLFTVYATLSRQPLYSDFRGCVCRETALQPQVVLLKLAASSGGVFRIVRVNAEARLFRHSCDTHQKGRPGCKQSPHGNEVLPPALFRGRTACHFPCVGLNHFITQEETAAMNLFLKISTCRATV